MSTDEVVFETKDETRYAPSTGPDLELVDTRFAKQLEKIPDKMAFKIGEVARLVGVKPYVLRYWETEFDNLAPKKSRNNQRVYEKRDVVLVMMIKKLLYEDRFSIEGARTALKKLRKDTKKATEIRNLGHQLEQVTDQVRDLIDEINRAKSLFAEVSISSPES
ncbi:MAG: MerR family transcriptional regulator [Bdellovibrionaceae bacterium]|nr:MerR family transcriptional regulator [Bdellovibrionales bacterium]MCB0384668.1 MerR family transcriptional regulator [Bdellovibrionales bacterium]MCB9082948.1 MerR family transcriptional regulator [Pseudobdellovibrionaceae bacterium]